MLHTIPARSSDVSSARDVTELRQGAGGSPAGFMRRRRSAWPNLAPMSCRACSRRWDCLCWALFAPRIVLPLLARGSGSSRQLACAPPLAGGTPPSFQIEELFSNADGTVQYVILREASGSGGNHRYTSDPMIKAAMIARDTSPRVTARSASTCGPLRLCRSSHGRTRAFPAQRSTASRSRAPSMSAGRRRDDRHRETNPWPTGC